MLEVKSVCSGYQETNVIWNIDLEVNKGQIVNILGANGSGKTTLLNTIMGISECRNGCIVFKGENITKKSVRKRVEMGLALVPEGRQLFPELTVQETLQVAALATKRGVENKDENYKLVFQIFPRLKERLKQRVETLSGGEQQMLTIARALMTNPDMLLLDEPSQGLAPLIVDEIYSAILSLNKKKETTILISEQQLLSRIIETSDMVVVLEFGKVVYKGPMANIISNLKGIYVG